MSPLPSPDRWRSLAPLLEQALERTPGERSAFLDDACEGDPGLRAEVEALLHAESDAGTFLETPVDLGAVADPAVDPATESGVPAGKSIGAYRVVREIGRGGMGVVYEAEQQRPRRPVALKVILGGRHVDADAVRMFQRESQSLARLKHPSIAAIYESGSTDEGEHFFAMELVQGRPLSDHLEEWGAPPSRQEVHRRLALFRKICAAVAYAHQRGVIHRDLKPSNILVLPSREGEASDIKVLDFGLARITDPDARPATAVTAIGRIQGTLGYMSPEQVRGRQDEVDVRTDVYSLGVILYRMLTGRAPHDLAGVEFPEAARIVCEQPPRPLRSAAGARLPIDHDLGVIVLKALEKDPGRRYQGVTALEEDVARWLSGQPILARPASAAYQIGKLVARHKVAFSVAGMLLVLLAGFATVATLQARRIAAERDRADREAMTAQRVSDFMTALFKVPSPELARGSTVTAREILEKGVEKISGELADEPEVQARLMTTMAATYMNLGLYKEAGPLLDRAYETQRRLHGEEDDGTLAAMFALGKYRSETGLYPDAATILERLLETKSRLGKQDDPTTRRAKTVLGQVYCRLGRNADCERLCREAYEGWRRAVGDDHEETIKALHIVGTALFVNRRYADAEPVYREAVERARRVFGEEHPATLAAKGDLGQDLRNVGRVEEAAALQQSIVEADRRILGPEHPHTLAAMHNYSITLMRLGRKEEVEAIRRAVLEGRRRVLGPDHFDTLQSLSNLAIILAERGRFADAETMFKEALESERRVLGENHRVVYETLYNLACLNAMKGDRRAAMRWLTQAVDRGYPVPDALEKDATLESIRGEPGFAALVDRVRANAGKLQAAGK